MNKNKEDKAGKVVIRDEHLSETPEITSTTIADTRMKIDAMDVSVPMFFIWFELGFCFAGRYQGQLVTYCSNLFVKVGQKN